MSVTSDKQGPRVEKDTPVLQMFHRKTKEAEEEVESTLMRSVIASYLSRVYLLSTSFPGEGNPVS